MLIAWLVDELKNAIHYERVLASEDPLTGILNRREFYARAALELDLARKFDRPFSLIYFDLDHFKQVNDEHGHNEGDRQLTTITQAISGNIRKTDIFARLGGDEFAVMLPHASREDTGRIVTKLVDAVTAELKAIHSPVTLSAGVVVFDIPPESVDAMIKRADALMYEAKLTGKNRVLFLQ